MTSQERVKTFPGNMRSYNVKLVLVKLEVKMFENSTKAPKVVENKNTLVLNLRDQCIKQPSVPSLPA